VVRLSPPFRFGDVRKSLDDGALSSVDLVRLCFDRIQRPSGEGARAFVRTYEESAFSEALESDRRRDAGHPLSLLDGIPVSIKDSIDEAGKTTNAGSRRGRIAERDSRVVRYLRESGAIVVGRTNMTEFAYSGLGLNPHFGTPASPWKREERRIPGGSSSGAAVSISDGFAVLAVGSDTGGSIRIPAAMCGVVGFKPTQDTTLLEGVVPLAPSLDSVGPLASDVEGCVALYSALSRRPVDKRDDYDRPVRLGRFVPDGIPVLAPEIADAFEVAIASLQHAGFWISDLAFPPLAGARQLMGRGAIGPYEAYAALRPLIAGREMEIDRRVSIAIMRGCEVAESEYRAAIEMRNRLLTTVGSYCVALDALVMPTVPILPPKIAELEADIDQFAAANFAALGSCLPFNILGMCAISVPLPNAGGLPIGIQLVAPAGADHVLLRAARRVQDAVGYGRQI
jgi:aspartyl-tRNA(Asn)/glutamyl-tRNA(Gln) amidotransferase subunit A